MLCNHRPPPACLNGREICDGIDECFCEQLEPVECTNNEFRCVNGRQCIPKEFYQDDLFNLDCQDGYDEIILEYDDANSYPNECDRDPIFNVKNEHVNHSNSLVVMDNV